MGTDMATIIGYQAHGIHVMLQTEINACSNDSWLTSWRLANGSVVSISRELQTKLGLDSRAASDPDDDSKVFYLVSGFHELHCLVSPVKKKGSSTVTN